MSLYGVYDSNNVFAKIIRGEIPCYKIFENEDVLSFLDLFPQSYGHCLVISKKSQARNLLEISEQDLCKVMLITQKISKVVVNTLNPDGMQICQFNGEKAGQTVFHLHFHIIPHYQNETLNQHANQQANEEDLIKLQQILQSACQQISVV